MSKQCELTDFVDPPNADEIIQTILNWDSNHDEKTIESYIHEILPNWLTYTAEKYSNDYPHLQRNWEAICNRAECTPKRIVFVKCIIFDQDHLVLNMICEFLTRRGYVIRRDGEFVICPQCNSVIPDRQVWELMRHHDLPVPSEWSERCRECRQSSN